MDEDELQLPVLIEPQMKAGGEPGMDSGLLFGGVELSTVKRAREKRFQLVIFNKDSLSMIISSSMITNSSSKQLT